MKMINGMIPEGTTCKYSNECKIKDTACNGNGCPVSKGKVTNYDFSCALARAFKTVEDKNK